jgi:hypothetical protein
MTIATLALFQRACQQESSFSSLSKFGISATSPFMSSTWTATPDAGAAPTTAVVPTRTTAGAQELTPASNTQRLVFAEIHNDGSCNAFLFDRLSHQGGLSGTGSGAQTTNLPTAALTRYTTGLGVWAFLEIYTQVGTTATTVTMSYTNEAGTTGRTSIARPFGGTGNREVGRLLAMPLQSGDQGVRAVASVTLAGSTLTAGNFGVTLVKLLGVFPIIGGMASTFDMLRAGGCQMPVIDPAACLFWGIRPLQSSTGQWNPNLTLSVE